MTTETIDPRLEALKAIQALNNIIIHARKNNLPLQENGELVRADFMLNTWFDATYGEEGRDIMQTVHENEYQGEYVKWNMPTGQVVHLPPGTYEVHGDSFLLQNSTKHSYRNVIKINDVAEDPLTGLYHACRLSYLTGEEKIPWHMVVHAIRQGLAMTTFQTYTLQQKDFDQYPRLKELVEQLQTLRK